MPRMSEAEKRKSHKRILDAASHLFRERGIEATSVSDVMQAAGLTHGGFYRHFKSKEALVADAFKAAVDEVQCDMLKAPDGKEHEAAREQYIARYLSSEHVDNHARGCPLAALGTEITRMDGAARSEASQAVESMARLLVEDSGDAMDEGIATLALLLGSITLARLADTPELAEKILRSGKRGRQLLERQT